MEVGTVRRTDIEETMRSAYLSYAMSVITARALPDVRDGLKPVQRRILYAMWDMGLRHEQPTRKSARIVGEVLGKYHPHGDMAVYDAMVRMAQDFTMRYTLVDGQGNLGSIDGDGAAAMRYTEARLSAIGEEMLVDLDKDTVDFAPNFDGSLQEPLVLPAKVPNLLVNGVSGIAVGMATNIPPHNLGEVVDAIAYLIDHYEGADDITVDDLMRFVPGPDLPSAGTILGREGIRQAYATGKGRLLMRAQAHVEDLRGGHSAIVVTELPFQVNKAGLVERIAELVRDGRIDGISDLRDESDRRTGMRVVVELKRGQDAAPVLSQLLKLTPMQTSFGINMLALVDGEPRVLPLKRILLHGIEHRHQVIVRRTQFELARAQARAHILEGLIIALNNLDDVIDTIRRSRTAETAQQNLMAKFKLTEVQARAILDMQLRRLAALERRKIEDEYQEILKRIQYLQQLLASKAKILGLVKEEMLELKQRFGDARRTRLSDEVQSEEFHPDDLLPDEEVMVLLMRRGSAVRLPVAAYQAQWATGDGQGRAPQTYQSIDDLPQMMSRAHSRAPIILLTDQGRAFAVAAHQFPDGVQQASGQPLKTLVHLAAQERIVAIFPYEESKEDRFLCVATSQGKVKRLAFGELAAIGAGGVPAIGLEEGDLVVSAIPTVGNDQVIVVTAQGKAIRFQEETVRPQGRSALGVRGITLKEGDAVIGMSSVRGGTDLLVVTARGYAKRTPLSEYAIQGRGGQGLATVDQTKNDSTGPTVAAEVVTPDQWVLLTTLKGTAVRIRASDVPGLGRDTWGRLVTKSGRGAIVPLQDDAINSLTCLQGIMEPPDTSPTRPARKSAPRQTVSAGGAEKGQATGQGKTSDQAVAPARATGQGKMSDQTAPPRAAGHGKPSGQAAPPTKITSQGKTSDQAAAPKAAAPGEKVAPAASNRAPKQGKGETTGTPANTRPSPEPVAQRTRRSTVTKSPRRGPASKTKESD